MARRLSSQLRSKRKLITVWLVACALAASFYLKKYCRDNISHFCEDPLNWVLARIVIGFVILLPIIAALIFFLRRRNAYLRDGSFRNEPYYYNNKFIQLYGKVERVLTVSAERRFRSMLVNLFRRVVNNQERSGRNRHQIFLISSPQLQRGKKILVLHNTHFGKVALRKGSWLDIKGEYLHQRGKERTPFGVRLSLYGKIHHTHEPEGYLHILSSRPSDEALSEPVEAD